VLSSSQTDLSAWLSDPAAAPHGGESLADLVVRVGAFCDQTSWSDGAHLLVVAPMVARAAAVHALGVPAEAIFRIDVAPLQRVTMSRSADTWRLTGLGSSDLS
jgi:broad specificity phosphatase PhoE